MKKIICIALAISLLLYPELLYAQPQRQELLNQREELLNRLKELEKQVDGSARVVLWVIGGAMAIIGLIVAGGATWPESDLPLDEWREGTEKWEAQMGLGIALMVGSVVLVTIGFALPEESAASREKKEIERKLRSIKWDLERLEEKEVVVSKKERLLKEHPEWSENVVKAIARESSKRRIEAIEQHPEWSEDALMAICKGKIFVGMTREQVIASWGRPEEINESVGVWGTHEQWVYYRHYLYFENGRLTGWQEEK